MRSTLHSPARFSSIALYLQSPTTKINGAIGDTFRHP
jgi:hypothetical protein